MSSLEEDDGAEFARAKRKTKFNPRPSCVPTSFESQSLVSSSSESHSRKSMGFSIAVMRSQSGLRRTSLGILAALEGRLVCLCKSRDEAQLQLQRLVSRPRQRKRRRRCPELCWW